MTGPKSALLQEFSNYYLADELPSFLYDGLDDWADESAARLAVKLGTEGGAAADLLRQAADDRSGPMVEALEKASVYGWTETDEDWTLFRHLVRRIADGIEAAAA